MSRAMQLAPRPPSPDELVYSDGEPMESARHVQQMRVLIESLEHAWSERTDFYAGGSMFLYFSETQAKRNDFRGPDVFVVMDTTRRERKAWVVWEEDGKTPDVVIELLSESTEHIDRGEKMRVYGRSLRIGEYFLFDPFSGVLEGYELDVLRGAYTPKKADSQGRLYCACTGLFLTRVRSTLYGIVEADWLRWMDREGRVLPMPEEEARALARENRALAEQAHAETERANGLEAELRALREREER